MKHISPTQVAADNKVRAPTRRALAKQQTRQKVLAAARRLFSEEGYAGATIRDIASAAGMSTGAVFANFTDKSDLFHEIMSTDLEALAEIMREAAAKGRDVEDALTRVFAAGYAFYRTRLPLARAAFSVGWEDEDGRTLRSLPALKALAEVFQGELAAAADRGELVKDADLSLRAGMLFDAYIANFGPAIFEGSSADALQTRARNQVKILLAGARAG